MTIRILVRKMRSVGYRLGQVVIRLKEAGAVRRKRRALELWLARLRAHPPDVLIGANFAEYGGVRSHIQAIAKYSSQRVELAPPDSLLSVVSPHDLQTMFRDQFFDFWPLGIKVAHSHVFPWFIEWIRQRRNEGLLWVHTYHLPYFPEHGDGGLLPWQTAINNSLINDAKHADVRISVSRWQQEWLKESHDIDTVYVPNGVDVELCDAADGARFVSRTGADSFVLYVGRNDPVKNPADFVRLAGRMPAYQFVMMGGGLSAASLLSDWQVMIPDNLLVIGASDHADVQDALAACGALVVTSGREGLPTVVLEAMAHSKPVVVPNDAGCVEAIGGGEYGFIYAHNDIDDLVRQTEAALSDSTISARSRARVLAEYDWRVVAPKLDRIYRGEAA